MFPSEHQTKFEKLRGHFIAGLPKREAELEELVSNLMMNGACATTLEALYFETHKLAGISGTYGLHGIGQLAEAISSQLDKRRAETLSEKHINELLVATDLLTEKLRQASARS